MHHEWSKFKGDLRIDTRDLIEARDNLLDVLEDEEREATEEEREFLDAVQDIENAGIEDFHYGVEMIREDDFVNYAQEYAEDTGAISHDASWPYSHIDWEAAADTLAQDFSSVSFLGHDYYVR